MNFITKIINKLIDSDNTINSLKNEIKILKIVQEHQIDIFRNVLKKSSEEKEIEKQKTENWKECALQYCRNVDYYKGLVDEIAKNFGTVSYLDDEDNIHEEVLRAKIPELVKKLKKDHDELKNYHKKIYHGFILY